MTHVSINDTIRYRLLQSLTSGFNIDCTIKMIEKLHMCLKVKQSVTVCYSHYPVASSMRILNNETDVQSLTMKIALEYLNKNSNNLLQC